MLPLLSWRFWMIWLVARLLKSKVACELTMMVPVSGESIGVRNAVAMDAPVPSVKPLAVTTSARPLIFPDSTKLPPA